MSNAMLDARQEEDSYRRIEVITGRRRRRRWTAQEKARIVAESFEDGANISDVARRHGVVRGLLTVWRHKVAAAAGVGAPGFVPVRIGSECSPAAASEPSFVAAATNTRQEMTLPAGQPRGAIEIEVGGVRVRVEPGVDTTTLTTVLSALRDGR